MRPGQNYTGNHVADGHNEPPPVYDEEFVYPPCWSCGEESDPKFDVKWVDNGRLLVDHHCKKCAEEAEECK